MVSTSFIKILFLNPILVYESCVKYPGDDCINNGWNHGN